MYIYRLTCSYICSNMLQHNCTCSDTNVCVKQGLSQNRARTEQEQNSRASTNKIKWKIPPLRNHLFKNICLVKKEHPLHLRSIPSSVVFIHRIKIIAHEMVHLNVLYSSPFLTLLIEPPQHYLTPIAPWVHGDDGWVPLSSDFQDVTLASLGGEGEGYPHGLILCLMSAHGPAISTQHQTHDLHILISTSPHILS